MVPASEPKRFGRGGRTRILVDDSFAYSTQIKFTEGELINRETVKQKVSEKIPDSLDNLIWDFVGTDGNVQVVGLINNVVDQIKNQKLKIEAIEPVSYSLARFVQSSDPTIIVYNSDRSLLIAVEKHRVAAVETFSKEIEEKDIQNFIAYTKEIFTNSLSRIIVSGNLGFDLKIENVTIENKILDPVESLRKKTDLRGSDSQSLILIVNGVHKSSFLKWFLLVIIFLGMLASGYFIFKNHKNIFPQKKIPISIPTLKPTIIPTPTIEEKKVYQVSVLNGSGITGEARKVADSLTALGLEVGNIGNAPNSNYQQTVISYKENVQSSFIDTIDTELQKNYTVIKQVVNNNTEQSDVTVIIGKLKK